MSYSYNNYNLIGYHGQPISYAASQIDPAQVAGYALATQNLESENTKLTDGVGAMSVFAAGSGAYKVAKYAKNNGTTVTNMVKETAAAVKKDVSTLSNIAKTQDKVALTKYINGNKVSQEIFNLKSSLPNAKKLAKMSTESQAAYTKASQVLTKASNAKTIATQEKYLKQAKTLIETAGGKASKAAKAAESAAKTAEVASKAAKTAETATKTAKVAKTATKTAETVAKTATTAGKAATIGSKALKCLKGNAAFIAIEGGIEVVTKVIPTFQQLGAKSGMKQVGKSAVKVGASVGGFAGGMALGAAIGSVIPGAGTAIGAVVGGAISLICGLVCSNAATKVAEKIVGKDELELAAEKQQQEEQNITYNQTTQNTGLSNQQLMQQVGFANPTTTQTTNYSSNPMFASYTTKSDANNMLMMPLNSGLQLTA